jgi:hypothetical protein
MPDIRAIAFDFWICRIISHIAYLAEVVKGDRFVSGDVGHEYMPDPATEPAS